jgi:hypothetical protein
MRGLSIAFILHELPAMKIRCAEIANLARSSDVVERGERLSYRGLVIEQMFLEEINVVGAESLQAVKFFITIYIYLLVRGF